MSKFQHETVFLDEAVAYLLPQDGGRYIDCTLGGAGHTARLLALSQPSGQVLAIDQDPAAHENARRVLHDQIHRVTLVKSNFRELGRIAAQSGFDSCDGILFDLGVSSPQFDEADRGFSYRFDANLDMRMDPEQRISAEHVVNEWTEVELADIFYRYGEEKFSRRIAAAIVRTRAQHRIQSTAELAEIVKDAIPAATRRTGPHPARRVFQALRIAVNDELGALEEALESTLDVVRPGGRISVITFHSLEDRIVKHKFLKFGEGCICPPSFPICQCNRVPRGKVVTRKPVTPSDEELQMNARARSAKLRVFEKAGAT